MPNISAFDVISSIRSKRFVLSVINHHQDCKKANLYPTWYDNLRMSPDGDCRKYTKQLVKHSRRPAIC